MLWRQRGSLDAFVLVVLVLPPALLDAGSAEVDTVADDSALVAHVRMHRLRPRRARRAASASLRCRINARWYRSRAFSSHWSAHVGAGVASQAVRHASRAPCARASHVDESIAASTHRPVNSAVCLPHSSTHDTSGGALSAATTT